jgi:hypothetical protein
MLARTRLPPPGPSPPSSAGGGGGVEFHRKLHFLSAELHLDPFPPTRLSALGAAASPTRFPRPPLTSHGLSTGDASRVFSVFPSPPVEPLRFLSTDAPRRLLAASVRGCLMWLCQTPRPGYELASTSTVHLSLDSETARSGSGMRTILVRVQSTRLPCNMICGTGNDLEFKVLSLQVQH